MTVSLSQLPEPPAEQPQKWTLDGAALAAECRTAVRLEFGPWRSKSERASDAERDALMQELALYCLEHPQWTTDRASGEPLAFEQRRAYLRRALRHIARDGRGWIDSLDDRETLRPRPRERRIEVAGSVAEQAERYRQYVREQRAAPLSSIERLTEQYSMSDGRTNYLAIAAHRASEQEAAEQLPAVALAAHSDALAGRMLERVEDALTGLLLDASDRESIRVALACAGGEKLTAIADAEGFGIATAKRRSARGRKLLLLLGSDALAAIRRESVRELDAEDREHYPAEYEPQSIAEVDANEPGAALARASVDQAISQQRKQTALYLCGSTSRMPEHPHGTAADVLAYIGRLERVLRLAPIPAARIATHGRVGYALAGALAGSRKNTEPLKDEPSSDQAWAWPDTLYGGQAAYSRRHPARISSVRWTFGSDEPLPRAAEPISLSGDWRQDLKQRAEREALTVARRIARVSGKREQRVTALIKLAMSAHRRPEVVIPAD